MHVVATAGHVDHGKSTLVRALTGSDPDRLAEEHRRGLSIELGYCWTALPGTGECAFVDVPGHEKFVPTMLSGVGPVPAVLFAVAADDDWMPQAAEHLAALDALGVRHGVIAVTRSDLADPSGATERVRARLAPTGLADAAVLPVSSHTGRGLDDLRAALVRMLDGLPAPDPTADVRLWVDRRFVVRGAGTVVTGTLAQGRVAVGDTLLHGTGRVRVRGVQTLGREVEEAYGVSRVALRLGGSAPASLDRGSVLVAPGAWRPADVLDVRVTEGPTPPQRPVLHVGAAALGCHYRPLADGLGRLTLPEALPLRIGDRALLRDTGSRRLWGVVVLDPAPPSLRRRGAAADREARLRSVGPGPDLADELQRRGWATLDLLRQIGVPLDAADAASVHAGGWLLDPARVDGLRTRLADLMAEHARTDPLADGLPVAAAANELGLPTPELVPALLPTGSRVREGKIVSTRTTALPDALHAALARLADDLRDRPFQAPDAARLAELGLDRRSVAAADKAALVLRVTDSVVLLPGADEQAVTLLRELPQPFTLSQARERLGTTRRVAVPLLELLDRRGLTTRLPDDRREVRMTSATGG